MRRQMLALVLLLLVSPAGCAVPQGQSPGLSRDEDAESQRTRVYHRPRWGMVYPHNIGGSGVVGIGGIGGVGGVCR